MLYIIYYWKIKHIVLWETFTSQTQFEWQLVCFLAVLCSVVTPCTLSTVNVLLTPWWSHVTRVSIMIMHLPLIRRTNHSLLWGFLFLFFYLQVTLYIVLFCFYTLFSCMFLLFFVLCWLCILFFRFGLIYTNRWVKLVCVDNVQNGGVTLYTLAIIIILDGLVSVSPCHLFVYFLACVY